MGFRIFMHSVRLVFNQWRDALRISGLLYLISAVISSVGIIYFMPVPVEGQPAVLPWQFWAISIVSGLIYLWIAVGWHRFVLLDEMPGASLPPFHGDRMLAYFGRLLQVGLIGGAVGIVFAILMLMLSTISPIIAAPGALLVLVVLLVISYRLAPIFPGAATARSIGVGAAWAATRGATGGIIVLAVVSALASIIIDLPLLLTPHLPAGVALTLIWGALTGWVKLMVGISTITTIYGVYVEKRVIAG